MGDESQRQSCWPCVLSVAGSDSGAGAGVQADLKTCAALGVYAATAITAVTAQNTRGVRAVMPVSAAVVRQQMLAVLEDFPVRVIKLGMLCQRSIVVAVVAVLRAYRQIPVVLDPVLVSSTGKPLLDDGGVAVLLSELLPEVTLVTPNIQEAALLSGYSERQVLNQPEAVLEIIRARGAGAVLLKGGHRPGDVCEDLLLVADEILAFPARRIDTLNSHGTGCTLASAIAAGLAKGLPLADAVAVAKEYMSAALASADQLGYGAGAGPLQHFFER